MNGVFQQINFMGLGVQVDVYAERMTDIQLGIFCLVGALATFCVGYLLTALAKIICRAQSKLLRAVMYYITIALLLLDPLYLSILCGFFGGGDMNGIALLCPGSFPEGFCGYYAEEHGEILYVGFHFSAVFGFFETGDFEAAIPVKGEIHRVVHKTGTSETTIWTASSTVGHTE